MEFTKFKDLLFNKARSEGFEDCEVYFINRESLSISVYDQEVEKYNLNKTFGLSFRGLVNGKMGYSFTEIMDEDAIDMLVKNAKDIAMVIESEDVQFLYEGDKEYADVKSYSTELEKIDTEKLIDIAMRMEREAKNYSDKVDNVSGCSISYSNSNYGIYNTKGLALDNKMNLLSAYVVPVVKDGENKFNGAGYSIAYSINELDHKKIAKDGVEDALEKIGGKSIPTGKYKAIINNEAMVSLLSTFSGIFNAEAAQKGLSLLKGKEGEMIASNVVTIIDDPHLEKGLASTPFDDEGVATYKKEVVSNGKLNTLLYNLKTAYKAGKKSTGNGFKASYSGSLGTDATNFYLKKGNKSLEKFMEEVNEGVLITEFAGLHSGANAITGDFSLSAKGFYIEGGKKSYPIEQITVAGNFFELLNIIEDVADDLKFPMSSVGAPSVKVKELSIAGK